VVQELVLYCGCLFCGFLHVEMDDVFHLIAWLFRNLFFAVAVFLVALFTWGCLSWLVR
jgi:hypothetical protein